MTQTNKDPDSSPQNISRSIVPQIVKYFGAALVGYIVDFGILVLLHEVFNIHYLTAASTGFVAGLVVVYMLSNRYVFGMSKISSKALEFFIFAFIGVIGLAILNATMWYLTGLIGISYILSKIVATAIVYLWNFFARRALYNN